MVTMASLTTDDRDTKRRIRSGLTTMDINEITIIIIALWNYRW